MVDQAPDPDDFEVADDRPPQSVMVETLSKNGFNDTLVLIPSRVEDFDGVAVDIVQHIDSEGDSVSEQHLDEEFADVEEKLYTDNLHNLLLCDVLTHVDGTYTLKHNHVVIGPLY